MILAKALKLKNRLAGEVAKLGALLMTCNSWEEGQEPQYDAKEVLSKLRDAINKLVTVKTAIAVANAGGAQAKIESQYFRIFQLAEMKGFTGTIGNISTRSCIINEQSFHGEAVKRVYKCNISETERAAMIKDIQAEIDRLQDAIDDYNASTTVAVDDIKV
jgi:hypothetical protein